jgi:hypothetical protein
MSITVPYRDVDGSGGYRYRQYANALIQILADPSGKAEGVRLRPDFTGKGPYYAIEKEIGNFKDSEFARSNKKLMEDTYAKNGYKLMRFAQPSWVRRVRVGSQGQLEVATFPTVGRVHTSHHRNALQNMATAIQLPQGMTFSLSEIPSGYRWAWKWQPGDQWTEPADSSLVSSAEISDQDLSQINFLGALAPRMGTVPASPPAPQGDPSRPQASQHMPGIHERLSTLTPGADPLDKAVNYGLLVAALVVGGGGYLYYRNRKGSWNDDDDDDEGEAEEVQMARVTILETGEEIEVARDLLEVGNEGNRAFLPYQGRIVEVQSSFIQKEGHPDAPTEAYMRRLLRGEVDPEDEDV